MIFLQILIAIFVTGWFFGRRGKNDVEKENSLLKNRLDQEIQLASDEKTKKLLENIKGSVTYSPEAVAQFQSQNRQPEQGMPVATQLKQEESQAEVAHYSEPIVPTEPVETFSSQKSQKKTYIDNTSLLLYFGAFLFITSVGLFIGFAEVSGGLKAAAIALVAAIMYGFGFWMHENKKQLKIVGEAFIGIGMTTVPFIGITAYGFSGDQSSNGVFIWLLTSFVALGLYLYTITKLQSLFVSYLLLGSIVSLLLSFAGVIDGPVYYYIWIAAATGIAMQFISRYTTSIPALSDASRISSQVFIPLTVFASFIALADNSNGIFQVAVTLALATGHYALMAVYDSVNRLYYALTSHVLAIATIIVGVYSFDESLRSTGIALLLLAIIHGVLLTIRKNWFIVAKEHTYIILCSSFLSVIFLLTDLRLATIAIGVVLALSSLLAYSYRYLFGFQIGLLSLITLSYAFGQWLPADGNSFNAIGQTILSLLFLSPIIYLLKITDSIDNQNWKESVRTSMVIGLAIAVGVALFSGAVSLLVVCVFVAVLCSILHSIDTTPLWRQCELFFVGVPLVYAVVADSLIDTTNYLTITTGVLLLFSVTASLRHKLLFARWTSTGAWLLLPIAIMTNKVGGLDFTSGSVIGLYAVIVLALSVSRAIAYGKILSATKSPIASMSGQGSIMYYLGMLLSAGIIVFSSFFSENDALGVITLITLIGYVLFHFNKIEKSNMATSLLPYLAQLVVLRFFEPYLSQVNNVELIYPIVASVVALTTYVYTLSIPKTTTQDPVPLVDRKKVALSGLYVAPFSAIYVANLSWFMPFSAIIAVSITLYAYKNEKLSIRESIGGALLVAIFWQLNYFGIDDIQIYSHLLAALFALYAYVRHTYKNTHASDNYIVAALSVATVPLALEALSGGSSRGEIIGLWLLLEQIGFLVLGVTIKKPLLSKWGLYVGIAAVLYQLRDLGWAMVAVLSVFVIGIAIYRALKQPEEGK